MSNEETKSIQCDNYSLVASKMLPFYEMQLNLELKEIMYRLTFLNTTFQDIAIDNNRLLRTKELDDCFTSIAFLMRQYKTLTEKLRYLKEEMLKRK